MTNAGINLIYLDCYKFNSLEHDIQSIGTMIGAEEKAKAYIAFLKRWKNEVVSRTANISDDKFPAAYIEGYTDYTAQGKDSGIDILMGIAKGKNLAADLGEQWPKSLLNGLSVKTRELSSKLHPQNQESTGPGAG